MRIFTFTHATERKDHGCDTSFLLIGSNEHVCLSPEYVERILVFSERVGSDAIFVSSCQEVTVNLLAAKVKYETAYGQR